MKPHRIKMQRRAGFRLPPNTVLVARPTKYGNPFVVGKGFQLHPIEHAAANLVRGTVHTQQQACWLYLTWLAVQPDRMREFREELKGKNLACYCELDEPCHADILLQLANSKDPIKP